MLKFITVQKMSEKSQLTYWPICTLVYDRDGEYFGHIDENGVPAGQGRFESANGYMYEGNLCDGLK